MVLEVIQKLRKITGGESAGINPAALRLNEFAVVIDAIRLLKYVRTHG